MVSIQKTPPSTLTPIGQASSEYLSIQLPLPIHIDTKRIGVDVESIDQICKISGISSLRISALRNREQVIGALGGVDREGNATAGMIATATAVKSAKMEKRINVPGSFPFKCSISQDVNIEVDVENMARVLVENGQIKSPSAWAEALDKEIIPQVTHAGLKALLTPCMGDMMMSSYGIISLLLAEWPAWLMYELIIMLVKPARNHLFSAEHNRVSFSPFGVEVIRAAEIALIQLRGRSLIREIIDIPQE